MTEDFDPPEDLGTQTKGKMGELAVLGELLRHGFQVYRPMVDTGIDCLVDVGEGNYKEVQIKSREDDATFTARKFKPRDSFFPICSVKSRRGDFLWVFPSATFHENATVSKDKRGKEYLQLRIGNEGSETFEKFRELRDNYQKLLSGASPQVRRTVRSASKRVEGEHLKQPDFMKEILLLMYAIDKPLQGKEIFERIGAKLSDKFSKWDLEIGKSNEPRWKKTAAFAFYRGLVPKKLVEAKTKNQWVLTDKGRTAAKEMMAEPKGLSLIELEELSNGLRVVVINVGNRPEQLTDFAVGDSGRKSLFHKKIAVEPGKRVELGLEVSPEMFKTGKPFDIRMWSDTGKEFRFKVPF